MIKNLVDRLKRMVGAIAQRLRFSDLDEVGRRRFLIVGAVLAVAAVAALGAGLFQSRHDDRVDSSTAEALTYAKTVVPTILTYTPKTVQQDLDAAEKNLTGEFKEKFGSMAGQVIIPSARSQGISTSAVVAGTSVIEPGIDSVRLLMFVNQTTTTAADPAPRIAGSRIKVTLVRDAGSWKVSELSPI